MVSPFLETISSACRLRGYSLQTEKTYLHWIKSFIYFSDKKHPNNCGSKEVTAFLTYLAKEKYVTANTQKVALNSLVFMYRYVIKKELGELDFKLAQKQRRLPTVLNPPEIKKILEALNGRDKLIFELLYGSGLRIGECLSFRVKDINLDRLSVTVVNGKGNKDRQTILSSSPGQNLPNQLINYTTTGMLISQLHTLHTEIDSGFNVLCHIVNEHTTLRCN